MNYQRGYIIYYDTDSYTDGSSEDTIDIFDEIDEYEINFQIEDKTHLKYYIGTYEKDGNGNLIMTMTISVQTFIYFEYKLVIAYLRNYFITDSLPVNIDIMQLHISNDFTYTVVLKTFWLRILQRTWRKIFNRRSKIIQIRKNVSFQEYFRINGKYPISASQLPHYIGSIKSNKPITLRKTY